MSMNLRRSIRGEGARTTARGALAGFLLGLQWLGNPGAGVAAPIEVTSSRDLTFRGGRTYLVAGPVRLEGSVRFEPGCVIKFLPGRSAGLALAPGAKVAWEARPEAPIVFTASDDDSVGEAVAGSTGTPSAGPYAEVALSVEGTGPGAPVQRWSDFRISHARVALRWTRASAALWHFQVQRCGVAIEATDSTLSLRNGLIHRVDAAFSDLTGSPVDGQQLTVARAAVLHRRPSGSPLTLLRCIIGEVADPSGFIHPAPEGQPNAVLPASVTNAFVEAAGSLYLPLGSRRVRPGFGHALMDPELAAALPDMTVLPPEPLPPWVDRPLYLSPRPIRDRALAEAGGLNPVKLGFHHWPIDHWAEGVTVSNAPVTVAPGTVVREAPGRGFRWIGTATLRRETEPTETSALPKSRPVPGRGDRDRDGRTDLDEAVDGTDPDDPSSVWPRTLAVLGFDAGNFATDEGVPPLPGSNADREPSFDRSAGGFHRVGQALRYPLVSRQGGLSRTNLLPRHGSVSLDYWPDWFGGRPGDAPGAECVLLEAPGLRLAIDAAGRRLGLTRISATHEQTVWSPLSRPASQDPQATGRAPWRLQASFGEETFDGVARQSHTRTPQAAGDPPAFSVGNSMDGQSPALGRIDRMILRNHLLPGTPGHPGPLPGTPRTSHRPLEGDPEERIWAESLATGVRLRFQRDWEGDWTSGVGRYPIERRQVEPTPTVWEVITRDARTSVYDDTGASPGRTYAYRVLRNGRPPLEVCAAHDTPPPADRGRVLLLVDETLADRLTPALARHRADLIADGWEVVQHRVPRHVDADLQDFDCRRYDAEALPRNRTHLLAIRALIRREHEAHPGRPLVAVLIGHPTIPQSGWAAEDGHVGCDDPAGIHLGAWPADLFYGDLTGAWTDTRSFRTGCPDCARSQCTYCILGNEPGDGRWDPNDLPREPDGSPGRIEVPIGRIDFARLSHFDSRFAGLKGSPRNAADVEVALLERYLDKAWRYRRGLLPFLDSAIGYANAVAPLVDRNLLHILPRLAPHEPVSATTWTSDLFHDGPRVRWGFQADYSHFGVLGMTGAAKAGHSHFAKNVAWRRPGDVPRVAFLFAFGSFLGQWYSGYGEDFLRICLAAEDAVLLAGTAHSRTPWATDRVHAGAPVHTLLTDTAERSPSVNVRLTYLLGDPCLLEHPLTAPTGFTARSMGPAVEGAVELSWTASSEADLGYRIDEAPSADAATWTVVRDLPAGTNRLRLGADARGKTFRLRGLGSVTNGSGRHRQWTAASWATP